MTNASIAQRQGSGIIDPLAIALKLRRSIPMIAAFLLVTVAATAAYVFTVPPVFTAWTQIVIDPSSRKPFDDPNAPSLLGNEALAVDTQLAVISSAAVLRPVVEEYGLIDDSEFGQAGKEGPAANVEERTAQSTLALSKALDVSRNGATYVISIGVSTQSRTKSAELSMAIANSYLREQQEFQLDHSRQLAEQIDGRLIGLRERLREMEEKVQRFRANKRLQSSADGTLLVGQELAGLNAQLVEARSALASANAANQEIQRYLKQQAEPTALGEIVTSPRVTQLLQEYSRAVRAEASLSSSLLPQHPSLLRAKSEIARISALIRQEIKAIGEGKEIELDVAKERVANLERQMDKLRTSSNSDAQELIVLRELETEASSTRAVYENVLSRAKQVANLEQVTMPIARIITPAQPPESPSWPKRKILLVLAAALGLGLGVAWVVAAEVWRQVRVHFSGTEMSEEKQPAPSETENVDADPPVEESETYTARQHIRKQMASTGSVRISTGSRPRL